MTIDTSPDTPAAAPTAATWAAVTYGPGGTTQLVIVAADGQAHTYTTSPAVLGALASSLAALHDLDPTALALPPKEVGHA